MPRAPSSGTKKAGDGDGSATPPSAPAASATYAAEVSHFRLASVVAMVAGVIAIAAGRYWDAAVGVEGGLALAGFALAFRLVVEFAPSTHAKVAFLHPRNFFLAT